MFRRGGSTNQGGGITANLKTPRQGFVNAGSVQQYPNLGGAPNPLYKPEPEFLEYSTKFGVIILLGLMTYVILNDIYKLFI